MLNAYAAFAARFNVSVADAYVLPALFERSAELVKLPASALLSQATYSNNALGEYLANAAHKVACEDRRAAASHRTQCERARAKWDMASAVFCDWAIANGYGNIRRNELAKELEKVPVGLKLLAADNTARAALDDAESAAVSAGHAWRGTFGMVSFYSPSDIRRFSKQRRFN